MIKTKRLRLRPLTLKDANNLSKEGNSKEINKFTWYIPYPFDIREAKKLILNSIKEDKNKYKKQYRFGIELIESSKVIGIIDLYDLNRKDKKIKIGYWIGKDHRNKGYISEAAESIIRFAFKDLKLKKISAKTLIENNASNHLLEKMGFRNIGIMKRDKIINGKYLDCYVWELINVKI